MTVPGFCKGLYLAILLSLAGCSDDNNDGATFNIRVSAVDGNGANVDLAYLVWGYGTSESPEGRVLMFCDGDNFNQACDSLDIGFEAQGEIWIEALSPLPGDDPECVLGYTGGTRIDANPSEAQRVIVTIHQDKGPAGICA